MRDESRAAAVEAIRKTAAVLMRPEVLTIRVVGEDRLRFLNGMLSNDVEKLEVGRAHRAVKASSKGRVEGVLRVRRRPSEILLDVREISAGRVAGELVKYVVMDDVQLSDATAERQVLSIHGPRSRALLLELGVGEPPKEDLSFSEQGGRVLLRDDEFGVESYELHAPDAAELRARLVASGAVPVTFEDLNVIRVEAGRPLDGVDIDLDTIPLEARLDDAVDATKGCYIGQEVIARATHRGGVKHLLVGLVLDGGAPPPEGAELWPSEGDRSTGEVTSAVYSPTLGRMVGLGYVRVEHEAPGTPLDVRWAGGGTAAEVVALPHVREP